MKTNKTKVESVKLEKTFDLEEQDDVLGGDWDIFIAFGKPIEHFNK